MAGPLELTPGRLIGDGFPTFIIAEIGQNHQGEVSIAKKMIRSALNAGADCVKFQKSSLCDKFTAAALKRKYSSRHSFGVTYGEHKRHLEFSESEFHELLEFSKEIGIPMTASAMDEVSLDFLDDCDVPFIKIGSGDANNPVVLTKASKLRSRPLVVSTGMCSMDDVKNIYSVLRTERPGNNFALLQCTSAYPTPPEATNLNVIKCYKKEFPDVHIGYSGHEIQYTITLAAVALGARIVERHFTLDKSWKGSDHSSSLDVEEFSEMVKAIRVVELGLGSCRKQIQPCEEPCIRKLGKSLVAARDLQEGHKLEMTDLKVKVSEPPGMKPQHLLNVVGKITKCFIAEDQGIIDEYLN